jgi:excisionase family DNA binding protein
MTPKYYTPQEAAIICNVSPRTIYRWIDNGKLPVKTMGKYYDKYILETDIPAFLRNRFKNLTKEKKPPEYTQIFDQNKEFEKAMTKK